MIIKYQMPLISSVSPSWQGAAPIARKGFAFGNGIFFADTPGNNRHARASIAELQEHFKSGSANDHPAHWFEAQLLHYDLKPSKLKSVARMRLFDAVNEGLVLPGWISRLEGDLKKEWTKMDREARKGENTSALESGLEAKPQAASAVSPAKRLATSKKAKAESATPVPVTMDSATFQRLLDSISGRGPPFTFDTRSLTEPTGFEGLLDHVKGEEVSRNAHAANPMKPAMIESGLKIKTEDPPYATTTLATASTNDEVNPGIARQGGIYQSPGRTLAAQPIDQSQPAPRGLQTARRNIQTFMPYGRVSSTYSGYYDTDATYDHPNDFSRGYEDRTSDTRVVRPHTSKLARPTPL